jgi:thiamine pyrophosphokinase
MEKCNRERAEGLPFYRHRDGDSFDGLIVAAGSFPVHPLPLEVMARLRDELFCCDGAADALTAAGWMPRQVVGDGDSITPQTRERLGDRLTVIAEQDSNDLTKTVRHCVALGYRRLCITGATGKREDHTLGNISLLADYMEMAGVEIWTDFGTLTPAAGDAAFESYPGQQISVFCIDPVPLTLHGLRWPVERRTFTRWWQGTLNEATGHSFRIETAGKIIVFREY